MRVWVLGFIVVFATILAGCTQAPTPPGDAEPEPLPPIVPAAIPFSESGQTEGYLCDPVRCNVVVGAQDVPLPVNGTHFTVNATYTWEPVDPTLPTLEVFLLRYDTNGEWHWEETANSYWTGTSPLPIFADVNDDEPWTYTLHARAKHDAPGGAPMSGGFSQRYDVSGVIQEDPIPAPSLVDGPMDAGNDTSSVNVTR